jgi:8-hydroxy-5-deazaflavin:NADPH oxidoreductase
VIGVSSCEAIDAGELESVWVSKIIGRPVTKAFNNILSDSLKYGGKPAGATDRIALSVAGDHTASKQLVLDLIDSVGFDGVDAGALRP